MRHPTLGTLVAVTLGALLLVAATACGGDDGGGDGAVADVGGDAQGAACPTNIDCSGHGTCVLVDGAAACVCEAGYRADGLDCVPEGGGDDPCVPDPCSGHGACADGVCTCAEGYAGDACDACAAGHAGYPDCEPAPCGEHGTPSDDGDGCDCAEGYAGAACDACATGYTGFPTCVPDPCAGVACSGHGACVVEDDAARCDCEHGFVPHELTCVSAYSEPTYTGDVATPADCLVRLARPFVDEHPLTDDFAAHQAGERPPGLDWAAPAGTPVYAVAYGTVAFPLVTDAADNPDVLDGCVGAGFGNVVRIRVGVDQYVVYGHLKADSVTVGMGQVVQPGQKIGEVGNTGHVCGAGSDGAHLHLGMWSGGWVDPALCFAEPPVVPDGTTASLKCIDRDLDTYGDGVDCWRHDCDDTDPARQSYGEDGCSCLADAPNGAACLDRDGDGAFAGAGCPGFDADCDDNDATVQDVCPLECEPVVECDPPCGPCQVCDTAEGTCDPIADGEACGDDGNECTDDVCQAGACAHPAREDGAACGDGLACADGQCQGECEAGELRRCWVECPQTYPVECLAGNAALIMGVERCDAGRWGACETRMTCDGLRDPCPASSSTPTSYECLDGSVMTGHMTCFLLIGASCETAFHSGWGPGDCPDLCHAAGDTCAEDGASRPCQVHCNTPDGPVQAGTQLCGGLCSGDTLYWQACQTGQACNR